MRPNIILITTDQQRYDTLGCNGSANVRTPTLDRIAGEGVRFDNAFVNNPVCVPSRACIQTGRYTHQHGVRYMETEIEKTPGLPFWEETFMQRLQVGGYHTGAAGKIHMKPPKGFDWMQLTNGKGQRWKHAHGSPLGPAQLDEDYARWLEAKQPGAYESIYAHRRRPEYDEYHTAIINNLPTEHYVDYWITDNALDFASQERESPYFLWFGICSPHPPVDPPADYAHLYPEDEIPLSDRYLKCADRQGAPPEHVIRRFISYYWALCTFIDDMVARLEQALKQSGQWDNTLLIFTSDHGEMMGDFGRMGKGSFDDAVIRVPMIVKPPAGEEHIAQVTSLVELIDIAPTILDYAGLRVPSPMQGQSLRPLLQGQDSAKSEVFCAYTSNDQSVHGKCIRTDRYKYTYWTPSGQVELYDLKEDPDEWRNLADDPSCAELRRQMHEQLLARLVLSERPAHVQA